MTRHQTFELARNIARKSVLPMAILFALSTLLQAFFAGSAAMIDPQYWTFHLRWVGVFQWLSVVLVVAAFVANRSRIAKWGSVAAVLIIGGQYTSIHVAMRDSLAWLAGIHAVGGFILFGVLVLVIADGLSARATDFRN